MQRKNMIRTELHYARSEEYLVDQLCDLRLLQFFACLSYLCLDAIHEFKTGGIGQLREVWYFLSVRSDANL